MTRTTVQTAKQIAATTLGVVAGVIGIDFAINVVRNVATKAEPAPIARSADQFIGPKQPYQTIAAGYICANLEQGMSFEDAGIEAGIEMASNHKEALKTLTDEFLNSRKTYTRKIIKAALAQCPESLG